MASISTGVRDAVVAAYYPRALAAPDSARSRAQAGYTIASAIAAALVAAGVLGGIDRQPGIVRYFGLGTLILWMMAAWLYMSAVSVPVTVIEGLQLPEDRFIATALSNAKSERDEVDRRQSRARRVSFLAALFTVLTFLTALWFSAHSFSPSTAVVWSRLDKSGKLSIKTTVDRLQRHDRVEVDVLGIELKGQERHLVRGFAVASDSGRVDISSELAVAANLYDRFVITSIVSRGREQLRKEDMLLRPE
jgi:hypothetical protein